MKNRPSHEFIDTFAWALALLAVSIWAWSLLALYLQSQGVQP